MINHVVKISIVNVQTAIEVPRSRIKSLDNISLIVMVKRINEISFVAEYFLFSFMSLSRSFQLI